ncbi:unnamed protein product [Paramecium sonneborni]|uniref:Uncharacterized protein n=1 Tax=Paramecium sonneborni TaxID=65129 RepID=A0A8S1JW07_9CILI|nr:unnamed protein product [Paramecium sonneborni]
MRGLQIKFTMIYQIDLILKPMQNKQSLNLISNHKLIQMEQIYKNKINSIMCYRLCLQILHRNLNFEFGKKKQEWQCLLVLYKKQSILMLTMRKVIKDSLMAISWIRWL